MKHKLFTLFLAFVVGVGTISAEGTWIKISELEHSTIESGTSKVTEMMYFTKIRINFTENSSNYGYITIKSQDTHPWVEICPFYYKGDGGISTVMVNTPYNYYIQENSNTRTSKSQLFSKGTKVDGMIKEFDMNTLAETEGQQFYVSSWQKNVLPDNIEIYLENSPSEPCLLASGTCGAEGNNLAWELSCDGVLTISGTGEMRDFELDASPWFAYKDEITSVSLPDGLTSIGEYAFNDHFYIQTISIPISVTKIGAWAFGNSNIQTIVIPQNVTEIGAGAFWQSALTSIEIPDKVKIIGEKAFWNSPSLTSVSIGKGVQYIGDQAFTTCDALSTIIVDGLNKYFYTEENVLFNLSKNKLIQFPIGSESTTYEIPTTVKTIEQYAFADDKNIITVVIPKSVQNIGAYAFLNCVNLTSADIPEGVQIINKWTFASCGALSSVNISSSVTSIEEYAFRYCSSLEAVTIPENVTSIGSDAFYGCTGLHSLTIPENVTTIGNTTFSNCTGLTEITSKATTPPVAGTYAFYQIDKSIPLFVPIESIEAYRTADQWKDFTNILPINSSELPSDITLQENESSDYYTQFAQDYNGRTVTTATLNRQFTQGKWATLCLPFNVNKAMMMSLGLYNRVFAFRYAQQLDDETIQVFFVPAQSIEAGKGYIVNPNAKLAAKTSFVFPNVTINTDSDNGDITALTGYNDGTGRGNLFLVGTLRTGILQGSTTGNTYLGLKDNQLYYPNTTSGTSIRAYRGFFRSDIPVNASRLRIIADGEPVSELQVVGTAPSDGSDKSDPSYTPARKYIEKGILYIERNGITYTAQGQRID